jgi:4a-hydroxytetrahydrobiopterin dehydratase
MTNLDQERCVACRKDSPRVTIAEIAELKPQIPEWNIVEHGEIPRLERIFRVKNFVQALDFTNKIGGLAEEEGHHPAILTEYGKVTVVWWTHKIKGLHRNDFIMAAKTDQIATQLAEQSI